MSIFDSSTDSHRAAGFPHVAAPPVRKLNIGCGFNAVPGFVNVDKSPACHPDVVFDIETQPWPWPTSSITEVLFLHSLEHMAHDPGAFLGLIRELYRVCAPDARIRIAAPHPRHDDFLNDPTHIRPITPMMFTLFDRERNLQWIEGRFANSPLAIYLGVDFVVESSEVTLVPEYQEKLQTGELTEPVVKDLLRERNNVAKEYKIVLRVRK
jgi:SAM-dependent methyltransferase